MLLIREKINDDGEMKTVEHTYIRYVPIGTLLLK